MVLPTLAVAIGLNEAIVLQQVHFWLTVSKNVRNGRTWVWKTLGEWQAEFPFWSEPTIRRAISTLEELGVLESTDLWNNKGSDRTKWYSINYERLGEIEGLIKMIRPGDQNDQATRSKRSGQLINMIRPPDQNDQLLLPEITTENTPENTPEITATAVAGSPDGEEEFSDPRTPWAIFEDEGYGTLTPFTGDQIGDWVDTYGEEQVKVALLAGVMNGVKKMSYVEGALRGMAGEPSRREVREDIERQLRAIAQNEEYESWEPGRVAVPAHIRWENGDRNPNTIWETAYGQLQLQMPRETFDTWLRSARLIAVDQETSTYTLGVANQYAREWLEHRLKKVIIRTLSQIAGCEVEIKFVLWSERFDDLAEEVQEELP
jgi:hypothetical protein